MSSDDDNSDLVAAFKTGKMAKTTSRKQAPARPTTTRSTTNTPSQKHREPSFSPGNFITDESSAGEEAEDSPKRAAAAKKSAPKRETSAQVMRRKAIAVKVAPVFDPSEYTYYEPTETVASIEREYTLKGKIMFTAKLSDGGKKEVTFDELLDMEDGSAALEAFQQENSPSAAENDVYSSTPAQPSGRSRRARQTNMEGYVDITTIDIDSEDDHASSRKPRQRRLDFANRGNTSSRSGTRSRVGVVGLTSDDSSDEDSDAGKKSRQRKRKSKAKNQEPPRRSGRARTTRQDVEEEEDEEDEEDEVEDEDESDDIDILRSDVLQRKRKRGRPSLKPEKIQRQGVRQSDRATRAQNNMQEAEINDIYRSDSEPKRVAPKVIAVREQFEVLPRSNLFRHRHVEGCETCGDGPNVGPLVYCQGCCLAYHKNCLGNRSSREHLVTKIGEENFVLQCRRCINVPRKKDPAAPDLSMCQDCHRPGASCKPFKKRKTPQQEQKDREDNGGEDPITEVPQELINNPSNVLFRCTKCSRAFHYHHLPLLSKYDMDIVHDEEETADDRFKEYSKNWLCKDCEDTSSLKVSTIVAWRPTDLETYRPGTSCEALNEDEKQYLIKWEGQSYFRASWQSGAWTWGVTAAAMRKAFFKRADGPKMRTEDAIPEEYLRIDIVLDVKYTSKVNVSLESVDKARINEVDKALIKYKGLGYEDAVWEKVPKPEDGDRWLDFVTAYNDWVAGKYIKYPKQTPLKSRLEKARSTTFANLEKTQQPENLVGGELMKYQIDGLNWIYFQWYSQLNGILADEMGLGKTIQVIAWMATLVQEHNCFPFLIVVPNATVANWRREIKQWVPSLRVVTYFGSSQAREMAFKYEMYPHGSKELRCHVVVTSYEAVTDEGNRRVFRSVNWAGLVVDEGQRLKNDKSQIYGALKAIKSPFRLLLTGTPLQNNPRELFNLLQFIDDTIDAAELEEKYENMSPDLVRELHEQIRPFMLRRTKAKVLSFLPSLGQIIVPLSMSHLQKQLYKSILAKNPVLLKALFTNAKTIKQQERANLSNILMQLRKCLCHPFVYSREIEERTDIAAVSHRNLVEASAKLQLLELLLPKLKERGHRVLIFSQFLDMLNIIEDFLDGMQMAYQRLDGTMGSLEKQKRIDQFNAPDSPLFAFLLSTRAGGVGINLATADTVIILDPDFNPHQDLQAISRAHRIGQKNKVLCFQLMTRSSVEEKIVQIGRKKMALDHVIVEQMDNDDVEDKDVESILKFGAAELFKDDTTEHDIRYDEASIDKLLDRTQIEDTKTAEDDSAESQFSFARVWANDQGALADNLETVDEEVMPDPGVWDKILKERAEALAAEQLRKSDIYGKGKRARQAITYADPDAADLGDRATASPVKISKPEKSKHASKKKAGTGSDSDTDFQLDESAPEESGEDDKDGEGDVDPAELQMRTEMGKTSGLAATTKKQQNGPGPATINQSGGRPVPEGISHPPKTIRSSSKPFSRAHLPIRQPDGDTYGQFKLQLCMACRTLHPRGACPLKIAGPEHCGLCGLAHFGHARTCPHIKSETQVREMLEALKHSPERPELKELALKYLRGVKGTLVQQKKKDREKAAMQAGGFVAGQPQAPYQGAQVGYQPPKPMPHFQQPPSREVPNFKGPMQANPVPGSLGSHLAGQQSSVPNGQGQLAQPPQQGPDLDETVETALRGFLGH